MATARILDSGAGIHLRSATDNLIAIYEGAPVALATANGTVKVTTRVAESTVLGPITSLVMHNSPQVLRLGRLIRENGISFYWRHGKRPVLITKEGFEYRLKVINHVP